MKDIKTWLAWPQPCRGQTKTCAVLSVRTSAILTLNAVIMTIKMEPRSVAVWGDFLVQQKPASLLPTVHPQLFLPASSPFNFVLGVPLCSLKSLMVVPAVC